MTLAIVLVIAAAVALILILGMTVSRGLQISSNAVEQVHPIDVEAFRNLVDPAEDEYLKRRLPAAEYRSVQRERLRASAVYIRAASRNASVLVFIGQAALSASDTQTAEAARQLVNNALLLRRNAGFALLRIYVALAWPSSGLAAVSVLRGYEQLNGCAMLLGRLQNPRVAVRISTVL